MKLEFLQKELERVSDWIRFSDRKTAFLSVYYTGIFSVLFSNLDILNKVRENYFLIILLIIFIISLIIGIYFLSLSLFPRLANKSTSKSLFYFGNISKMKIVDFFEEMESLTEERAKKQIIEQIYTNSEIADKKMRNVQASIKALFISIIFLLVLLILI